MSQTYHTHASIIQACIDHGLSGDTSYCIDRLWTPPAKYVQVQLGDGQVMVVRYSCVVAARAKAYAIRTYVLRVVHLWEGLVKNYFARHRPISNSGVVEHGSSWNSIALEGVTAKLR